MIYQIVSFCTIMGIVFADGFIDHHHQPYDFGYSVKDHHGEQHRHESGDGGHAVEGSYGFTDDRGVHRQVDYVADHAGFRADVKTNEPGTANQDPAAVKIISSAHPYFGAHEIHGEHGHGYAGYGEGFGLLGHGGYGDVGYGGLDAYDGYGEYDY